jgi:hypothetical protein
MHSALDGGIILKKPKFIIPIFLIFTQLLILLNSTSLSYPKVILLAGLNALTIIFHQYHVLFYFSIVFHFIMIPFDKKVKR